MTGPAVKTKERVNLTNTDKQIFWNILKNCDDGKLYKVIMTGTKTNDQKHKVWQKISDIFNNETGHNLDAFKSRTLFQRLKGEEKKKHDADINKQFNKDCGKTGGGTGPTPPQAIDGDDISDEADFLDPTDTDSFNFLTTYDQHTEGSERQQPGCSGEEPPRSPLLSTPLQLPLPMTSRPPTPSTSGPRFRFPGSPMIRMPSPRFHLSGIPSTGGRQTNSVSPSVSQTSSPALSTPERLEQVIIVSGDGSQSVEEVVTEANNNITRGSKAQRAKKDDPANKYYTEMLAMQTTQMKWKEQLVQLKIKTEMLKHEVLKKQLKVTEELEESSDSDNEVEDF